MKTNKKTKDSTPEAEAPVDAESPETTPEAPAENPVGEADPRDAKIAELENKLLRLQADFDNFRKRTARERLELSQTANEGLLLELLPVVDHYEMGLSSAERQQADPAFLQGFRLVYDQLLGFLRRCKVEPIAAEGQPFDPHAHEAITHLPSEEHPADTVIAETRRGYRLGDRLLRAAQVVVSSGSPASAETRSADAATEPED